MLKLCRCTLRYERRGRRGLSSIELGQSESHMGIKTNESCETLWKKVNGEVRFNAVTGILRDWISKGNVITRDDMNKIMGRLFSQSHYNKGYRVAWWVNTEKPYELNDSDHMLCLEFASRAGNLSHAFAAFSRIVNKTEASYVTLLQLYVPTAQVTGGEKVMNFLRESKLITSPAAHNLMISIYFRAGHPEKAQQMFLELEEMGIEANIFTYYTMMKNKEQLNNLDDLKEKAELALRKQESKSSEQTLLERTCIMKLNAALGKEEDVGKIWDSMRSSNTTLDTYLNVLDAYGLLENIEKLEEVSKQMEVMCPDKRMKHMQCFTMIRAYSRIGVMEKAESMLEKMKEMGYRLGYQTYHHIVAGYIRKRDIDKGLEIFRKSVVDCGIGARGFHLPLYSTVLLVMKTYEEKADVANAEELMKMISVKSYPKDSRIFNGLLKVYLNAKIPAYGIENRMSALSISPDDHTLALLHQMLLLKENVS